MDPAFGSKSQQNIPPLGSVHTLGTLSYPDTPGSKISVDINGCIDKGFFVAENEWTCYRRNYFSCICSFSLSPYYHNQPMQFVPTESPTPYAVSGFAMSISAAVAENDEHAIDLVQHTPKRDKGPTTKPDKVRLSPRPAQPPHHSLGMYPDSRFENGYGQQNSSFPTEYTFERIQFKQATANNGKRRAAQQYYHLLIELWAEVAPQPGASSQVTGDGHFVRVAYKKSAKMIVRGRSPGHYQSERRPSTSSGPGSGGGSMGGGGGGYPASVMGAPDVYGSSSGSVMGNPYQQSSYGDPRGGGGYGGGRHHPAHDLTMEPIISQEEIKIMKDTVGYQYFPQAIYESAEQDARQHHQQVSHHQSHHGQQQPHHQSHHQNQPHPVELFSSSTARHENESPPTSATVPPHMTTGLDAAHASKVKSELEGSLPPLFYPGLNYSRGCGRFDGKPTSTGYYPTVATTMLQ
jgi:meiosis-specific transcription factor NDT80